MPNFIEDDENIIVFDYRERPIPKEDYSLIASSGVRTAMKNVEWFFIEPTQGHYDWSEPDEFVENCVSNDIKVLLITPDCVTACMPDDWYCQSEQGVPCNIFPQYSQFSPWHTEAQAYQDNFTRMVIDRYASVPVRVIRGGAHGGESLMPYEPSYFDPKAIESFRVWANGKFYGNLSVFNKEEGSSWRDWDSVKPGIFTFGYDNKLITKMWLKEHLLETLVRQQSLLVKHYGGEAWMMLAHCWKDIAETGNFLIPDVVQVIKDKVNPTKVNWIAFAHFNMGASLQRIAMERLKDGIDLWTGAQYCEGLPVNTPLAKQAGIRGLICGPLAMEDSHDQKKIEPWMVDNLKQSIAEWRA
jgi:hypothetical protein